MSRKITIELDIDESLYLCGFIQVKLAQKKTADHVEKILRGIIYKIREKQLGSLTRAEADAALIRMDMLFDEKRKN